MRVEHLCRQTSMLRDTALERTRWAVIGGELVTWPQSSPLIGDQGGRAARGRRHHAGGGEHQAEGGGGQRQEEDTNVSQLSL